MEEDAPSVICFFFFLSLFACHVGNPGCQLLAAANRECAYTIDLLQLAATRPTSPKLSSPRACD